MSRLSPRVKAALPVKLDTQSANLDMLITELGINGAFVSARSELPEGELWPDAPVSLCYNLNGRGRLEHRGRIIRRGIAGYAVNFHDLDGSSKHKLWEFIVDNLTDFNECPYCGKGFNSMPAACTACGWDLDISSPGYFHYHGKMCTVKKLQEKIAALNVEQLHRIIGLIDADDTDVQEEGDNVEFVGTGSAMLEVFSKIRKVAPTDLTVLILGESGTGKEMTAQAIHERSTRKDRPFVAINCGAIPDTLLEAELFGFERGAFTGAYASKKGKFECADGGTIFLDEIGEMPFTLQVKLLRVLQDKNVERIGSVGGRTVDVRLIAATNCDLHSAIEAGRFRSDLYYRLDEFTIKLPPVRERGNDRIILARFFLNKFSREMGMTKTFSKEAIEAIQGYDWPGNVRELINKIRRGIVMSGGSSVTPADLDLIHSKVDEEVGNHRLSDVVTQLEIEKIKEVLNSCGHNISKSAHVLGITRQTLHRRLKLYGIQ